MKSRIVILLSVTLAALLLVVGVVPNVMPNSPVVEASPDPGYIKYVVPFTCGIALDDKEGVKPANYATTVLFHNSNDSTVTVYWKIVRLFPSQKVSAWIYQLTEADKGKNIKCNQIAKKLSMAFPLPKFITGFVVIWCWDYPLDVYGIYTCETEEGVSIDTEHYDSSSWLE